MTREEELFMAVKAAYEHRMLDAVGNMKLLNNPHSPLFNPWENVGPLLALILGSLFVLLVYKLLWGTLALLASCGIYLLLVRPWMAWRMHARLVGLLLRDLPTFKTLWGLGGFSLIWVGYPPDYCLAPKGDWQKFADRHAKPLALPGSAGPAGDEEGGDDENGGGLGGREERRSA
ncbi:MAG: hypothetical protein OEL53_07660 [Rhodospirillales bacterium]|jgi:hypothetical protein|nr:hypothetical protein [Rhodospirillales bacterium]